MSNSISTEERLTAQSAAYASASQVRFRSTALIEYQSNGHVLIIADSRSAAAFGALASDLSLEFLLLDEPVVENGISIEGALGRFEVQAGGKAFKADLVLDLSPQAILPMALKPPGYFWADSDEDYPAMHSELQKLVGTFEKPKYFEYKSDLCAHGRSGHTGCTRCIDACPAEAIRSLGDLIAVNPYRCQGGGVCASVCPSGAIQYAFPMVEDLLNHVRTLVHAYVNAGGGAPDMVFVNEAQREQAQNNLPQSLIVCVEEVASVGPEVCLSALAWGASKVLLFDLEAMPESSRRGLELQVDMLSTVLGAMQYPQGVLSIISGLEDLNELESMPEIVAAKNAVVDQKRQVFYMALDHLVEQADQYQAVVSLPSGSIFGDVTVDADACTLCMACVSACPGNALQAGGESPQLGFVESSCLQCDICTSTCPEDAISTSPRLLLDRAARNSQRVLHKDSPFHCVSCGKAFATASGIATIMSRLADHSMFADDRARYRLKMCGDCRVKDMMEDPLTDL